MCVSAMLLHFNSDDALKIAPGIAPKGQRGLFSCNIDLTQACCYFRTISNDLLALQRTLTHFSAE